jgi:hypothetical protein
MGRHRVVRETVAVDVDEYVVADDQNRCVERFDTREEAQERTRELEQVDGLARGLRLPATTFSSRARRSRSGRPVRSRRSWYSRSKAMNSGGVATASGSGSHSHSNRDRSSWS